MSKKTNTTSNYVYSTNPNFKIEVDADEVVTPLPKEQKLKIWLNTKHRAGKVVTLVDGFVGKDADMETLGKSLKNACGTGGSVKDGEIIIQGDHRDKVLAWLLKNGYTNTKKAGG